MHAQCVFVVGWAKARQVANGEAVSRLARESVAKKWKGHREVPIDWALAEKLALEGETLPPLKEGDPPRLVWPSFSEIARRLGCHKTLVHLKARRNKWPERRKLFRERIEHALDVERVDARVRALRSPLEIVDDYLALLDDAVRTKKVSVNAAADLDKVVRLRAHIVEREQKVGTQKEVLTLEQIQERYRRARAEPELDDDEVAGVHAEGDPAAGA